MNSNLTDAYFEFLYLMIFTYKGLSLISRLILRSSITKFPIPLKSSINTLNILIFQPYKLKNFFFHFSLRTIIPYIFNPMPILYELLHYVLLQKLFFTYTSSNFSTKLFAFLTAVDLALLWAISKSPCHLASSAEINPL